MPKARRPAAKRRVRCPNDPPPTVHAQKSRAPLPIRICRPFRRLPSAAGRVKNASDRPCKARQRRPVCIESSTSHTVCTMHTLMPSNEPSGTCRSATWRRGWPMVLMYASRGASWCSHRATDAPTCLPQNSPVRTAGTGTGKGPPATPPSLRRASPAMFSPLHRQLSKRDVNQRYEPLSVGVTIRA